MYRYSFPDTIDSWHPVLVQNVELDEFDDMINNSITGENYYAHIKTLFLAQQYSLLLLQIGRKKLILATEDARMHPCMYACTNTRTHARVQSYVKKDLIEVCARHIQSWEALSHMQKEMGCKNKNK